MARPQLVAHRGCPSRYPENSLPGCEFALRCGATWIEVDVQCTADGALVLCHDAHLTRSSGLTRLVHVTTLAEIQARGAGFADTFGARYRGMPMATLEQFCRLVQCHNDSLSGRHEQPRGQRVRVFVEIKPESALHFGRQQVVNHVTQTLTNHLDAASVGAILSRDPDIVRYARDASWPTGWVLPKWDEVHHQLALGLQPEILFCSIRRYPRTKSVVWPGTWRWAIYTVNDTDEMRRLTDLDIDWIETDCIDKFLNRGQMLKC